MRIAHLTTLGMIATLALMAAPLLGASINLNSSRSNIYRLVWADNLGLSKAQATNMLRELDRLGPADDAKLKVWMTNNFRKFGVNAELVKEIHVFAQRQISCDLPSKCQGKRAESEGIPKAEATATVKGFKSNRLVPSCFCYEPLITSAQVRQVNSNSPIVIFILSDKAQKDDAFGLAVNLNSSKSN